MQCRAPCHCPQSVAFWRQKEQKVLFSETPLPLPTPLPRGDVRHPQLGKPPRPKGAGCFPCRSAVRWGRPAPRHFLGEAPWQRWPVGARGTDHSPGLCVGLCRFGLCVAVTQIVTGIPRPGGAVQRVVLIIGPVRGKGLPVAGRAAGREEQGHGRAAERHSWPSVPTPLDMGRLPKPHLSSPQKPQIER